MDFKLGQGLQIGEGITNWCRASSHGSRHGNISPAEFGDYNKYIKMNFVPMSKNRIPGE